MLDLSIFKNMFTFFRRSFGLLLYIIIFVIIITFLTSSGNNNTSQSSYGTISIAASDNLKETKDFKDLVHFLKKYYKIEENISDIDYALETTYIDGYITVPDNFLEDGKTVDVKTSPMAYSMPLSANINQFIHAKKTNNMSLLYKRLNVSYLSNNNKQQQIKQFYVSFMFLAFRIYCNVCYKLYTAPTCTKYNE